MMPSRRSRSPPPCNANSTRPKLRANGCCWTTTPTGVCRAKSWKKNRFFGKPQVLEALSDVRLLRLDVTADNAASRELLGRYKVPGPPSLLWIGPDGEERRSQRITGEVDAGTFLQRWTTTRDAR